METKQLTFYPNSGMFALHIQMSKKVLKTSPAAH